MDLRSSEAGYLRAFNRSEVLPDVQNHRDKRGVQLNSVGVSQVDIPLQILEKGGSAQRIIASTRLSVGLTHEQKGTHLSRFISQLSEWSKKRTLSLDFRSFLSETADRLHTTSAQIKLDFQYFIDKQAPVTRLVAPMGYRCSFQGALERISGRANYQATLTVNVPVSTLCPCSKAISSYGAHNQRTLIRAVVCLSNDVDTPVWIEDLVRSLEECSSCPVYPLLKREDEKYVTERQYENPMFVEDVCREVTLLLRNYPGVEGFLVEVEALESIHGHNAWTSHRENFREL